MMGADGDFYGSSDGTSYGCGANRVSLYGDDPAGPDLRVQVNLARHSAAPPLVRLYCTGIGLLATVGAMLVLAGAVVFGPGMLLLGALAAVVLVPLALAGGFLVHRYGARR